MKRWIRIFCSAAGVAFALYSGGWLYYRVTDGFTLDNIASNLEPSPLWNTREPTDVEKELASKVLLQPFTYLGKGCQSYVFASADGAYVLKFIKHQRFRAKPWLDLLSSLPFFEQHRKERLLHKQEKLFALLEGWKVAFDALKEQTGILWVHINPTDGSEPALTITDKMGYSHVIDLNVHQYLLQRRATPFEEALKEAIDKGNDDFARSLLDQVVEVVLGIHHHGFIDRDPALMQNSAVLSGRLMLIDVGQLARDPMAADPEVYKQSLFNKSYRLRFWLKERAPELQSYLEARLVEAIGAQFEFMQPDADV